MFVALECGFYVPLSVLRSAPCGSNATAKGGPIMKLRTLWKLSHLNFKPPLKRCAHAHGSLHIPTDQFFDRLSRARTNSVADFQCSSEDEWFSSFPGNQRESNIPVTRSSSSHGNRARLILPLCILGPQHASKETENGRGDRCCAT